MPPFSCLHMLPRVVKLRVTIDPLLPRGPSMNLFRFFVMWKMLLGPYPPPGGLRRILGGGTS